MMKEYYDNMLKIADNMLLVFGNDKISKMSYGSQIRYLIKGINNLCPNTDTDMTIAWILSLFDEQVRKKHPNLSKKQSMNIAVKLFKEEKESTRENENIKRVVLQKARNFYKNVLIKTSKKIEAEKDELYIPVTTDKRKRTVGEKQQQQKVLSIVWMAIHLGILAAIGLGLMLMGY